MADGKARRRRMSGEQRAEAAARLMSKTGKLDDREAEELWEIWEDVCSTHVKAVFGKLAKRVGATEAQDLTQEVLADGYFAVCEGPPGSLRNLLLKSRTGRPLTSRATRSATPPPRSCRRRARRSR